MLRAIRRIRVTKGTLLPVLAAALAVGAGMASCISGPPPDPPRVPAVGPVIIQNAVRPAANEYLTELPDSFRVPVRAFNPNAPITCAVFVDFDPGSDNSQFAKGTAAVCPETLPALDGGPTILDFSLSATSLGPDPNACHTIQCFVEDFPLNPKFLHVPGDSLGSDSVVWEYSPNGPGACDQFDAGDGAFPSADASDGGVPLTPDAVGPAI